MGVGWGNEVFLPSKNMKKTTLTRTVTFKVKINY